MSTYRAPVSPNAASVGIRMPASTSATGVASMISKASDGRPQRRRRLVKDTIIETAVFLFLLLKDIMTQQTQGAISLQSLP